MLTGILVAVIFGVVFSQNQNQAPSAVPTQSSTVSETPDLDLNGVANQPNLQVHVVGAVVQPGLYKLDFGSRVSDAISAAGGFTEDAVQTSVNLARQLADGEQVVVLSIAIEDNSTGSGLVSLNRADESELDELPGIGPALAARIVSFREERGGFSSVSQLQEVSGIGAKVYAQIEPLVTL